MGNALADLIGTICKRTHRVVSQGQGRHKSLEDAYCQGVVCVLGGMLFFFGWVCTGHDKKTKKKQQTKTRHQTEHSCVMVSLTRPVCQLQGVLNDQTRQYTMVVRLHHKTHRVVGLGLHSFEDPLQPMMEYHTVDKLFQTTVQPCADDSSAYLVGVEALNLKFKLVKRTRDHADTWVLLYPFADVGKLGVLHTIVLEKGSLPFTFHIRLQASHTSRATAEVTSLVARRVAPPWFVRQAMQAMEVRANQ
jgi:hypothetical protein